MLSTIMLFVHVGIRDNWHEFKMTTVSIPVTETEIDLSPSLPFKICVGVLDGYK